MNNLIRLHNMVLHTSVLGPGTRTAIWLQGCKKRCKGCMSPDSRPLDGGRLIPIARVIDEIISLNDIEGITISGGEPFLQADALCALLQEIRKTSSLGVIIYTGYTLAELHSMENEKIDSILSGLADIIIDGEYVDEMNDGGALKGSSNQTVHYITPRYLPYKEMYESKTRNTEVVASNKDFFFIGIPPKKTLEEWENTVESTEAHNAEK